MSLHYKTALFGVVLILTVIYLGRRNSWQGWDNAAPQTFVVKQAALFGVVLILTVIYLGRNSWQGWDNAAPQTFVVKQYRYTNPMNQQHGIPMSPQAMEVYHQLNLTAPYDLQLTMNNAADFVFVTGASENHFSETVDAIASVQQAFPNSTILYYDLGLQIDQKRQMESWCNVQLVSFDFLRYPPHVNNLKFYAFKFLLLADALESHPGVLWFDASARFVAYDLSKVYEKAVHSKGFLMFKSANHGIFATTHATMYEYLPTDLQLLQHRACLASGTMLIYRTPFVHHYLLHPAVLCSLVQDCISPTDQKHCSKDLLKLWDQYIGCHRYDQSMINILALNAYGFSQTAFFYESSLVHYQRWTTHSYELRTCGG